LLESQTKFLWAFEVQIYLSLGFICKLLNSHGRIFLFCCNSKSNNRIYLICPQMFILSFSIQDNIFIINFDSFWTICRHSTILIFSFFFSINGSKIFLLDQNFEKLNTMVPRVPSSILPQVVHTVTKKSNKYYIKIYKLSFFFIAILNSNSNEIKYLNKEQRS